MSTATIARARASTSHYQNAGQGVNNGTKHYGWGSVSNQDHMVENGYHASAWARAGFKDDRFVAAAGASAGVVKLHMKGHHSVTVNNLGSIGAGYEFFSGSYVGAEGNLSIGRDGVSANVSGGAFAGTTYGINASAEVLGVGAEASAGWVVGVGAKGSAHASFKDETFFWGKRNARLRHRGPRQPELQRRLQKNVERHQRDRQSRWQPGQEGVQRFS